MKHNRLRLEPAELKILFDSFDRSREGWARYKDFLVALRGYMSDYRRSAAEKLYERLLYRSGKKGLAFDDVAKAYKLDCLGNPERSAAEQTAADFLDLLSYHQTLWCGDQAGSLNKPGMRNNAGTIPHISTTLPSHERTGKAGELTKACLAKQIRFVDPEFRPQFSSLFRGSPDLADRYRWRDFQWARAVDVLGEEEFSLFNEIAPQNLMQGQLENTYFLCALAALAERPALIRRLFDSEKPNLEGLYAVWLNISGAWRQVIVDDFFPVEIHGNACEFAFSRTKEDEVWPLVLEKAYAKAYGSYDAVACGQLMHCLRDLTGAPYEVLENISGNSEELWKIMTEACERNFVITCWRSDSQGPSEHSLLQPGHSHTVVDCVEVNDSFGRPARLVLVRNVWSDWRWTGDWSKKSHLWTPELQQRLNDWDPAEGLCWLAIQDFLQCYQTVGICQVEPHHYYNSVKVTDDKALERHIIRFDVEVGGAYTLSIDQLDPRLQGQSVHGKDVKAQMSYFRLLVGRLGSADIEFKACRLSHLRSIFLQAKLEAGAYVALVDSYWYPQASRCFTFGIYGPGKSGLRVLSQNEGTYCAAEFEIWKNYSLTVGGKFVRQGTYTVGENAASATISKFNLQDMKYGVSVNKWEHERGQVSVVKGFSVTNKKNLEVITESGNSRNHFMTLNQNSVSLEVFKLDPRCSEFSLTQDPIAMELIENQVPGHKSVRPLLLAYSAAIPSYCPGTSSKPSGLLGSGRQIPLSARNSENKEKTLQYKPETRKQALPKSQRQSTAQPTLETFQPPNVMPRSGAMSRGQSLSRERPAVEDTKTYESRAPRGPRGNYVNPGPGESVEPIFGNRDLGREGFTRLNDADGCSLI